MIIPRQIKKMPFQYFILSIIFLTGLILYFFIAPSASTKRVVVYLMAAAYFFWSLYHHYKMGDLTISIIVEYLTIALLGIVLLTVTFF